MPFTSLLSFIVLNLITLIGFSLCPGLVCMKKGVPLYEQLNRIANSNKRGDKSIRIIKENRRSVNLLKKTTYID
jgi:hypothetical protein